MNILATLTVVATPAAAAPFSQPRPALHIALDLDIEQISRLDNVLRKM